ncbi:Hypothetical protein MVR_LOCUS85 [uncultured virus]|nr:Hypothetical protein MVR_LOCUS85 [uncultured virus]
MGKLATHVRVVIDRQPKDSNQDRDGLARSQLVLEPRLMGKIIAHLRVMTDGQAELELLDLKKHA